MKFLHEIIGGESKTKKSKQRPPLPEENKESQQNLKKLSVVEWKESRLSRWKES